MSANAASVPTTVLVIDDDPVMHVLINGILKSIGLSILSAMNGEEGLAKAREHSVQLILLDNEMPGSPGIDVLRQLKAERELASIPVIMVTGAESNRVLSEGFAAGAVDYLRKPFASAELRARVHSVIERQELLLALTQAARYDRLTGLANRALLTDRLAATVERVHQALPFSFAVMFLDFDRFKFVNDTLGHDVGDLLLQAIAGRLLHNLRDTTSPGREQGKTTVARLGGDEFVVILEGVASAAAAEAVAERLLIALDRPYQLGIHSVRSTASIGTVLSAPHYLTADEMLRDADIAMYEAKARGKACHVMFTEEMRDKVRRHVALENALHEAMGTPQLCMAYQPIVALDTNAVCGIEALVRWTHPTLGAIAPDVFIPLAEDSALILPFSEWVLKESCALFMRLRRALIDADRPPLAYVSVNLSRVQFSDPSFVERTLRVLRDAGMRPDQLQLETTEAQVALHKTAAVSLLAELRGRGVRIAMDNFGSGQSSLSCLHEFSLDVLKISRTLIANATRGREFAALLHAVLTLAENLEIEVIAQGVETSEQLVLLQAFGCPFAQGYLLSEPLTGDAMMLFLQSDSHALAGARA